VSGRRTTAVAVRVLRQLRHDPRTIALIVAVPCVLMTLLRYVYDDQPAVFQRLGPMLLVLFPFTVMFVVTSVAMLRERTTGTLERLLTMPIAKADVLGGYALAFGLTALVQVAATVTVSVSVLGLDVIGSIWWLVVVALLDALLGMALGLFLSAFARTEFQAVQFLPAFVLPQLLLCGLFIARDRMAEPLRWLSDVAPLTYAVEAARRVALQPTLSAGAARDMIIVAVCVPVALGLGALTLRRRTS